MTWAETSRPHHDRDHDRYASECTDGEETITEPFMPSPSRIAQPGKSNLRVAWNAIQNVATTGFQGRCSRSIWRSS